MIHLLENQNLTFSAIDYYVMTRRQNLPVPSPRYFSVTLNKGEHHANITLSGVPIPHIPWTKAAVSRRRTKQSHIFIQPQHKRFLHFERRPGNPSPG